MNKIKNLILNTLMLTFLLGILVLPATSFGLLKVNTPSNSQVLSAKDVRLEKLIKEKDAELKRLRLEIIKLRQLLETYESTGSK